GVDDALEVSEVTAGRGDHRGRRSGDPADPGELVQVVADAFGPGDLRADHAGHVEDLDPQTVGLRRRRPAGGQQAARPRLVADDHLRTQALAQVGGDGAGVDVVPAARGEGGDET